MNFPSFPSSAPLLSVLPISTVQISLATEWFLYLLITRFQPAVWLLFFWNLSSHWTFFPAKGYRCDLKTPVKDVSSFLIHKQNWTHVIMLCRQVSPHFCSCSILISVPDCLQHQGSLVRGNLTQHLQLYPGNQIFTPCGPASALFLGLTVLEQQFWRDVRCWVISKSMAASG